MVVTGRTTQGSSIGTVNLRFDGNSVSGDYINGAGGAACRSLDSNSDQPRRRRSTAKQDKACTNLSNPFLK